MFFFIKGILSKCFFSTKSEY